ncbi:hypothetical protein K438DRAFT_2016245 [Mycena galopus ATCC 62051]|nr:hypothetical protein K438DRAFT_2016245 [Mycena galopus ATCC 62051]
MSSNSLTAIRLISVSDPPRCPLPAVLGPPKQSACFSICNERLDIDSTAALHYFVNPPLNASLRDGLEKFLKLPIQDRTFQRARRLDNVFALSLHSKHSEELLKAEVVTWRGIMTKIMMRTKLNLNISFHRGVLYLEEDCPPGMQFDLDSETTYMGHKFETICSTASTVDLHKLWNVAITRTLGAMNILLVGEVDCVKTGYSQNPGPEHYVELKTRKMAGERVTFPNGAKWAMQSHLLGTPEIFVGLPDSNGIVRSFKTFSIADKPPTQDKIDWGARVIHSLKEHCMRHQNANAPPKVWRVEARSQYVNIRELDDREIQKLNKGGVSRNGIIPVSFLEGLAARGE